MQTNVTFALGMHAGIKPNIIPQFSQPNGQLAAFGVASGMFFTFSDVALQQAMPLVGIVTAAGISNALRIIKISNNLGDAKSLVTHPSTTTHQRFDEAQRQGMGISQGMLRLSAGIEDADDLIEDLDQALRHA